jgi:hypothetical protein
MKGNMTPKQQIVKYARVACGFARLARSSREPSKLIAEARTMADKLQAVAEKLAGTEDARYALRSADAVTALISKAY